MNEELDEWLSSLEPGVAQDYARVLLSGDGDELIQRREQVSAEFNKFRKSTRRMRTAEQAAEGMLEQRTLEASPRLDDRTAALYGQQRLPEGRMRAQQDYSRRRGSERPLIGDQPTDPNAPSRPMAKLGTDVEGALQRLGDRGRRIVVGDGIGVIDDTGQLQAYRPEHPSIAEHFDALREGAHVGGKDSSKLGFAANILDAGVRGLATAYNIATDDVDDDNIEALEDVLRGMSGERAPGKGVREGGNIAYGGWADVYRKRMFEISQQNPQATVEDFVGGLDPSTRRAVSAVVDDETWAMPLSEVSPDDPLIAVAGLATDMVADPLNLVGGFIARGIVGGLKGGADAVGLTKAAKAAAGSRAGQAVAGAGRAVAESAPGRAAGKVASALTKAYDPWAEVKRALTKGGEKASDASKASREMQQAVMGSIGEMQLRERRFLDDAVKHDAAARDLAKDGRFQRELENRVYVDDVEAARRMSQVPDEALQLQSHRAAKQRAADVFEQDTRRVLETDAAEVARQRRIADSYQATIRRGEKVPVTEDVAEALSFVREYDRLYDLASDASRYASRLAVETKAFNLLDSNSLRAIADLPASHQQALVDVGLHLSATAEDLRDAGRLPKHAPTDGYFPHVFEGFDKPYSPLRKRRMIKRFNRHEVRLEAADILDRVVENISALTTQRKDLKARGIDRMKRQEIADTLKQLRGERDMLRRFVRGVGGRTEADAVIDQVVDLVNSYGKEPGKGEFRLVRDSFENIEPVVQQAYGEGVSLLKNPLEAVGANIQASSGVIVRSKISDRVKGLRRADGSKFTLGPNDIIDEARVFITRGIDGVREPPLKRMFAELDPGEVAQLRRDIEAADRGVTLQDSILLPGGVARRAGLVHIEAGSTMAKKFPSLEGQIVKSEFHDAMRTVSEAFTPENLEGFLGKVLRVTSQLVVPVWLNTPGFHHRNFITGVAQSYWAIGARAANPRTWNQAEEIARIAEFGTQSSRKFKIGKKTYDAPELAGMLREYGLVESGIVADLQNITRRGTGAGSRLNPLSQRGILGPEMLAKRTANRAYGAMARVPRDPVSLLKVGDRSASIENLQKAVVFLGELKAGKGPSKAAETATRYLFDYTGASLAPFERELRRAAPFYQWLKFSTRQMVDVMLEHPGRFANTMRLYRMPDMITRDPADDPRVVPEYMRRLGGVAMPEAGIEALGRMAESQGLRLDPAVTETYLGLQHPASPVGNIPLSVDEAVETIKSSLAPALSIAAEFASKKRSFGGGPISAARNLPLDDDRGAFANMVEQIFGVPVEDVAHIFASKGGSWAGIAMSLAGLDGTPRFDENTQDLKLISRLVSTLTGQKVAFFEPAAVLERRMREDADLRKRMFEYSRYLAKKGVAPPPPTLRGANKLRKLYDEFRQEMGYAD